MVNNKTNESSEGQDILDDQQKTGNEDQQKKVGDNGQDDSQPEDKENKDDIIQNLTKQVEGLTEQVENLSSIQFTQPYEDGPSREAAVNDDDDEDTKMVKRNHARLIETIHSVINTREYRGLVSDDPAKAKKLEPIAMELLKKNPNIRYTKNAVVRLFKQAESILEKEEKKNTDALIKTALGGITPDELKEILAERKEGKGKPKTKVNVPQSGAAAKPVTSDEEAAEIWKEIVDASGNARLT